MVLLALIALTLVDENNGLLDAIPVLGSFALGAIRLLPVVQQIYQSYSQIRGVRHFGRCLKFVNSRCL